MQDIKFTRLSPAIGAEVTGLSLGEIDAGVADEIYQALCKHLVLFFHGQNLSPAAQINFAKHFGELDVPHKIYPAVDGFGEIVKLENDAARPPDNDEWHTDLTYLPKPPFASILQAISIPKLGGDTLWASMVAAYEALPKAMQDELRGLKAVHDMGSFRNHSLGANLDVANMNKKLQETGSAVHALVKTHPTTGAKYLYANQTFTRHVVGLTSAESDRLLQYLYNHINRPDFQVRLRWANGSVAMWDNRATQHYAVNDYSPAYRCMHRVTVVADRRAGD